MDARRWGTRGAAIASAIVLLLAAGCGSHARPQTAPPPAPSTPHDVPAPAEIMREPQPLRRPPSARTLEAWDPYLGAALLDLARGATAERHIEVAAQYRRLDVLDMAYTHFAAAAEIDPRDARPREEIARIWRDWGFASAGLRHAARAVSLAPYSSGAANTLGTLFQAVGDIHKAREWYQRALLLNPNAWYAQNNLCDLAIRTRTADAIFECRRAVDAAPQWRAARNNLALAYAAAGDSESAREHFAAFGDDATVFYNLGIAHMARREFDAAAEAFSAALRLDPQLHAAAERARQARAARVPQESHRDHP